ncbi:MAG TPA: transglutaminase family protein, partial [Vicinamibacteria bacterium]|nr:transglutaminase family protein [Vicinamibacteria bacterium]
MTDETLEEVRQHDAVLRARGLDIWIGAEPTFTRRESQEPWWLTEAEGGDKESRARSLLQALAPRLPQRPRLSKVAGRQFPDEPRPRFSLGAQWPRHASGDVPPADALDGDPVAAPLADPEWAWLTVTPDPGVVEVNMAPAHDLETFLQWSRDVYAAAAEAGLSPVRYRWNGQEVDSGGGGQITLGGPS